MNSGILIPSGGIEIYADFFHEAGNSSKWYLDQMVKDKAWDFWKLVGTIRGVEPVYPFGRVELIDENLNYLKSKQSSDQFAPVFDLNPDMLIWDSSEYLYFWGMSKYHLRILRLWNRAMWKTVIWFSRLKEKSGKENWRQKNEQQGLDYKGPTKSWSYFHNKVYLSHYNYAQKEKKKNHHRSAIKLLAVISL